MSAGPAPDENADESTYLDPENMTRRERIEHLAGTDNPAADLAHNMLNAGLLD